LLSKSLGFGVETTVEETPREASFQKQAKNGFKKPKPAKQHTWHGRAMWHGQAVPPGTVVPPGTAWPCQITGRPAVPDFGALSCGLFSARVLASFRAFFASFLLCFAHPLAFF